MEFFVPGRTELIGNHTDHQKGRVLAAAVSAGISARAERRADDRIVVHSEGFETVDICSTQLAPRPEEAGRAAALVRGMAFAMAGAGFHVGGFEARIRSDLKPGGGLSSSAAFTVLIGRIINELYNGGRAAALTIAECAQRAENLHFGKPCGLMDQLVCAMGGTVYIDFLTGECRNVFCDFGEMGFCLCLTDTGGSHVGLTEAYAAILADMHREAERFGRELLGYVNPKDFFSQPEREDAPYLRAKHFFEENDRVPQMRRAIEERDGAACAALMNASGRSSERLLKNIRTAAGDDRLERGLALSGALLAGRGAWRVHGGGFAGCVQALVPCGIFEEYRTAMDAVFGAGSCMKIM